MFAIFFVINYNEFHHFFVPQDMNKNYEISDKELHFTLLYVIKRIFKN